MLAHSTGNKVLDAYQRSDHLERRRVLLERWAVHVTGRQGERVLQIHAQQKASLYGVFQFRGRNK